MAYCIAQEYSSCSSVTRIKSELSLIHLGIRVKITRLLFFFHDLYYGNLQCREIFRVLATSCSSRFAHTCKIQCTARVQICSCLSLWVKEWNQLPHPVVIERNPSAFEQKYQESFQCLWASFCSLEYASCYVCVEYASLSMRVSIIVRVCWNLCSRLGSS